MCVSSGGVSSIELMGRATQKIVVSAFQLFMSNRIAQYDTPLSIGSRISIHNV